MSEIEFIAKNGRFGYSTTTKGVFEMILLFWSNIQIFHFHI